MKKKIKKSMKMKKVKLAGTNVPVYVKAADAKKLAGQKLIKVQKGIARSVAYWI
ncbi:MAG: hypothetical protein KKB81_04040 [Candidatus Margulisbacteria bacterium]|nr:hypothetical protein [Candidatus Margulisiibacteriota bacterium]MBU1021086.1 hypothetical protein [Candidatus Margulisiibacteriota bacterium]MBU1729895.1 hypothetical protein [Candidatus Margulisiibacteriota bacterium]MBU1955225.1 hypothetical protein [Candidatus Margulisiibacteriota bacterium]